MHINELKTHLHVIDYLLDGLILLFHMHVNECVPDYSSMNANRIHKVAHLCMYDFVLY